MKNLKISDSDLELIRGIRIHKILNLPDNGRRQMVSSPFSQPDRNPSCCIYPDNSFYCFKTGKHGKNAIDFVVELGYSFTDALNELAKYL